MKNRIFGYARISTMKQSIERQINNIKDKYPDAIIFTETFSGTTLDRPEWNKLYKQLRKGDVVVFDEVSRMSRNAEEGYALYRELYDKGVTLVFLKESTLNTDNFRQTAQVALTGNDIADIYIEATNKALMLLAEKQIQTAFQTAQHEVDFLHKRTSEGVKRRQKQYDYETAHGLQHEKERGGRIKGSKIETKKAQATKQIIKKHAKDFGGTLSDPEVIRLAGIARNSYYKYKAELKAEQ